jgi:hypothetical protein
MESSDADWGSNADAEDVSLPHGLESLDTGNGLPNIGGCQLIPHGSDARRPRNLLAAMCSAATSHRPADELATAIERFQGSHLVIGLFLLAIRAISPTKDPSICRL